MTERAQQLVLTLQARMLGRTQMSITAFELRGLLAERRDLLLRLAPGWQTIDSAPKDGTEVLLSNGSTVSQGYWLHNEGGITEHRDEQGRYVSQDEDEGFIGWWDYIGGMSPEPTHWQSLPTPPAAVLPMEAL